MVVVWLNEKDNDEVHDREIDANFCWVLMCNSEQKIKTKIFIFFNFILKLQIYPEILKTYKKTIY